jgi:uncharacterized protein
MRKVDPLRELQAVDTAIDQARARLARIASQWGRREALDAAGTRRDAALVALRHQQGEQKDLELEIDKMRGKLKADSDKLYSGRVHSPRELDDLSKEVEQDRRQVSTREDRLLEVFDLVSAAEAAAREAEDAYQQTETAWKRDQEQMAAERKQVETEGQRLTAQRQQIVAHTDPASLRLYESLRRSKGGLAVVAIQQRTCQGCRIALPSSEEQKARTSTDLVLCSSCGRILYA